MPNRINLRRDLLRLWFISTLVWIAAAAAIFRSDWPASTLWSLGPFGTINQLELEVELRRVDGELDRLEGSGTTRFDAALADLDATLSGKPLPSSVANWEKLQTERDTITSRINLAKLRTESWSEIGRFAVLSFGPPVTVFLLGASIIWAVRGFVT